MKKSFKKAIAVLLTVLMVVCSMPFTALAAIGDYQPDLRLQFGTFYASGGANWVDYSEGAVSGADFSMSGLYDVPVDFNYTLNKTTGAVSGTLYIDKDKANKANEVLKYDNLTENLVLGVGDYFQVTLIADNINKLCEWSSYVTYSNNIEPAGYYSYKSGRNTKYAVGTVSECTAAGGTMSLGGYLPIDGQSGTVLYPGINKEFGDPATSQGGAMFCELSIQDGSDYYDLAGGLHNDYYADPATGDLNGYTYTNCMIINTFVFKITGEGDITFALEDTDGSKYAGFVGGKYRADDAEGNATSCYTTYAVNSAGNADGSENAGSRKMTFMGYNVNVGGGEEACTHTNTEVRNKVDATCTTDGYTGDTVCLACGETIATGTKIPATGHTPVSADNAVAATCTTDGKEADTVCSVCGVTLTTGATINKLGHNYTSVVTTEATCTEAGVTTWTCTRCGDSYTTNEPAAKGHTEGEIPAVEATCTTDGSTAGTRCSVCGVVLTAPQKIDKLGHDYTSAVTTEATCTEAGVTTWTCTRCGDSYTTNEPAATGHTPVSADNAVAATCTTDGKESDTVCSVCGETLEVGATINKLGHDFSVVVSSTAGDCQTVGKTTYKCSRCDATKVVDGAYGPHTEVSADNAVAPTCTTDGKEADTVCSVCGATIKVGATIPATGHTEVSADNAVAPTCTTDGKEADTVCSVCGATIKVGATIPATGHTPVSADNAVAATCVDDGKEADTVCSVCGVTLEVGATIPATGHTPGEPVETTIKDATCTEKGEKNTTVTCTVCGATISSVNEEISATGHTPGEPVVVTVPATVDAKGSITTTISCTVCGAELHKEVQEIPMLASYDVTVEATDLGTVTLNGADVTVGKTVKVEAGKTFTLTATPVEGATFLGWKANGATTVSTATTFKTTALADVTYTPVFEIENESKFTVQFVDAFGNIVSAQQVGSGAEINIPTAPTRPGYEAATENGWSMTNDEITALEASATITAQYTKAEETLYTITATGCDITANGETVKDTVSVAYDTKVTVKSTGATAWEVNGVKVGYGESYTFFVTADIELVPVTNAVVETPQVANVGVGTIGATGKIQAVFKATRTMTDDCKYISSGFVYGNGDLGEITLDNVNGSTVKAAYTKTSVEQFTLTYGLRSQDGIITARAFLAYVDANGNNVVIYADPMTYTYNK